MNDGDQFLKLSMHASIDGLMQHYQWLLFPNKNARWFLREKRQRKEKIEKTREREEEEVGKRE